MLHAKINSDGTIDAEVVGNMKEIILEFVVLCTNLSEILQPEELVKIATIRTEYYEYCK